MVPEKSVLNYPHPNRITSSEIEMTSGFLKRQNSKSSQVDFNASWVDSADDKCSEYGPMDMDMNEHDYISNQSIKTLNN